MQQRTYLCKLGLFHKYLIVRNMVTDKPRPGTSQEELNNNNNQMDTINLNSSRDTRVQQKSSRQIQDDDDDIVEEEEEEIPVQNIPQPIKLNLLNPQQDNKVFVEITEQSSIVPKFAGVDYSNNNSMSNTIDVGNTTYDDCITRPYKVIEDNLEQFPATRAMYDNLIKTASYLSILIPATEANAEDARKLTESTQKTLENLKQIEENLNKGNWWQRKLVWGFGIASTLMIIASMLYYKCVPTIPVATQVASPILTTVKELFRDTVSPQQPDITRNIFMDYPLTCISIVAITTITVIGIKGSLGLVRWSLNSISKLRK
jgi:hypothetical protein